MIPSFFAKKRNNYKLKYNVTEYFGAVINLIVIRTLEIPTLQSAFKIIVKIRVKTPTKQTYERLCYVAWKLHYTKSNMLMFINESLLYLCLLFLYLLPNCLLLVNVYKYMSPEKLRRCVRLLGDFRQLLEVFLN